MDGVPVGPLRIWAANADTPGLSMTRAFGDAVAVGVGLSSEPEMVEAMLQPADKYLLLASDGIFEFMEARPTHASWQSRSTWPLQAVGHDRLRLLHLLRILLHVRCV